jgi:hypothetical protein
MNRHTLLSKILSLLILFSACNFCTAEDTWIHNNATTNRDPLFIDMPNIIHQLEPVTVNIIVNDPLIKAEANAVDLGYEKFFTLGKQIGRSNDGTLRIFVPYNGEGSIAVGFKDNAAPTQDNGRNVPSLTFTFYKVKKLARGVDPRSSDPSSEYYGMQCGMESSPYYCSGTEGCELCLKNLGTVSRQYFLAGSTALVRLPSGYNFTDNKKTEGVNTPGSVSYSYLKEDKAISQNDDNGRPITCEDSYSLSLSTGYYSMYTDLKYERDWQLSYNKVAMQEGGTTVEDTTGPGGLFPGKAVEVISKDYTSGDWDLFSIDYQLIAKMDPLESGTVQLSMNRRGCAPKGQGKGEIDKALSEVKAFGQSYQVVYDGGGPASFKPVHEYNVMKRETPSGISGRITDGHSNPMPYLGVTIAYDGKHYEGRTDEGGNYAIGIPQLKLDPVDPAVGTLGLSLSYVRDGKNYFNLLDHIKGDRLVSVEKNFSLETEMDKTQDFDFGVTSFTDTGSTSILNNLKHIGPMYYHLSEVTDFALSELKANIDYKLPVDVYFASAAGTAYSRDTSSINIKNTDSAYGSSDRPDNREYHEFCHHIMFSQWNGSGLRGPGDSNHDGYINTGTGDSYTEGFAEFCAMACSKYRGEPKPDIYAGFGSLELNYKSWGHRGYDEELAIAGILWDLYDDKNDKGDTISIPVGEMWDILKVRRPNFYEYYKAFKAAYPDKSDAIDKIFLEHGFFADKDKGNGAWDAFEPFRDANGDGAYDVGEQYVDYGPLNDTDMTYDAGETIGKATNYERENRSSIVKLRDSYVKASDPAVTKYLVKVRFPDAAQGADYEYSVDATDGLVYIAPIPEDLGAEITVEPDTVAYTSDKPYKTTNREYVSKYYAAKVGSGFVDTHDFEIKPTGLKDDVSVVDEKGPTVSGGTKTVTKPSKETGSQEQDQGTGIDNTTLLLGGAGILLVLAGLGLFVILIVVVLLMKKKGKK